MKSLFPFIAALLLGGAGVGFSQQQVQTAIEAGDTISIAIPFENKAGGITPIRNVRLVVTQAPAWIEVDTAASFMGPVDIYPGELITFNLDSKIADFYNPAASAGNIILNLVSDSTSYVPSGITWSFATGDGFRTMRGTCAANDGNSCGNYIAPDTLSPGTYLVFDGPVYEADANTIYLSTHTLINFIGSDAFGSDEVISRVAVTGYSVFAAPAAFEALNFSTVPITLAPGANTLYYASRDYAGNTEVIKSSTVYVDGAAPGQVTGLQVDGVGTKWKNVNEFHLSWINPSDVSGIAGMRVKYGEGAPVYNEEGIFSPADNALIFSSTRIINGVNVIWLWVEDNVGNADLGMATSVELLYDGGAPVSTASAPSISGNVIVPVAFSVSDLVSGAERTTLWWRLDGGPWSSGTYSLTGSSGTFLFNTDSATGNWEFYTQALDKAGNSEAQPVSTGTAKASVYVDATPPVFSNVRVTEINYDSARISWETSDETFGLVEYGLSGALGSSVSASGYLASRSVLLSGLVYPANYYFKISALNKPGLWGVYSGSFYVPPKMTTNVNSWGVINTNQPIVIEVTNPAVSSVTYTLNYQTVTQTVSPNIPLEIYVPSGQGQSSLSLNMAGFAYAADFIVDTATRTVFLARFVNSAGGLMSSTQAASVADATFGQAAQVEMEVPGGGSKLYLGYYAAIDSVAPGSITYLTAGSVAGSDRAVLTWTAPGDDASVGTAVKYDVRWSTSQINSTNFLAAARGTDIPFPLSAGITQEAVVSGLNQLTTYYFSIRTEDELSNVSGLSNLASVFKGHVLASTVTVNGYPEISFTSPIPPSISLISTVSAVGSVAIGSATAGGLTLAGNLYEIGPEGVFDPPALLIFYYSSATLSSLGLLEADLAVYEHFPEAGWLKLPGQVLDTVAHKVTVPITRIASLFGVFGIVKDRVPPVTELVYSGAHTEIGGRIFINSGSSVTLNAFDPVVYGTATGVSFTEYRVDPGTAPAFMTYLSPFTLTQGAHIIEFHSRDKAGNTEAEKYGEVYVDTAAPVTAALISGTTGQNDWYVSAATVTLVSTDSLSGLAGIYYHADTSTVPVNYTAPIVISSEGISYVYYYAEDAVGNRESENILRIKVDIGVPSVIAASTPSANTSGWNNTAVGIVFTGSDTVSGLAYCSSSTTVSGEGAGQVLNGSCFDNAGLSSTAAAHVSIDTTPPSIQYSSAPWPNEFGWNSSTVTLSFACADVLSGVKNCPAPAVFTLEGVNLSTSVAALDKAGNQQTLSAGGIKIDKAPPVSSSALAGAIRNNWYSSPVAVTLASTDVLSGVRQTMYSADGAAFAAYQQAFNLSADGPHVVKYYALDKAGNTEAVQTASINIDTTAPQVGYTIMPPPNPDGWNKGPVNVVFSGTDTLSGVEICSQIFVSTEGPHQAAGWCRDRAGNQGYSTAPVKIDLTSPTVNALASPPANGRGWNNTAVTVVFSGHDTLSGDPICMGGGTVTDEVAGRIVSGSCMNKAGLVSYVGQVVNVDKTAPALSISSPVAGQVFIATRVNIGVKFGVTDNLDPAPAYRAWFEQVEDRGSPRGARPARLAVANGQFIEPLDIDDGIWRLIVSATDFADNAAQLTGGAFEVIHDVLAPRTSQAITAGPSLTVGATTYITSAARLELTSIDDLVSANDGIGLGVKDQSIRVKSGGSLVKELLFANPSPKQGEAFISTVTGAGLGVTDGSYNLAYNASDVLGNIETEKSVLIGLDNTAPASSAGLAGTAGGNGWHISTVTINLTATDALSGVAGISYGLDGGAYLAYTSPVETATEGQRTVRFYARDRLGNTEAGKSVDFKIDRTAPAIVPERSPAANVHGWNKTGVTVSFTCSDAVSGVQLCPAEAAFSIEGFGQAVSGTVRDYAGHASSASVGGINIDKTAPAGSLSVTGELWESGSDKYLNPRSVIALAATDGLSGVEAMEYHVDEAPFGVYSSSFSLAEGIRAVHYHAIDKADNIEATRTALYRVDGTGPATFLKAVGGSRYSGPEPGSFYASLASRFTLEAADPVTNGVASGVRLTSWSDNGSAAVNTTESLAFAEGRHVLAYWSMDNVDNQEVTKSTTILVDNTAPVTTHHIGSPYYAAGGVNYITPATPLTFTAADPVSGEVASGVSRIEVSLDSEAFGTYSSMFKFSEGRHTIRYRSVDNVGNVEAEKTLEVQSDNTVPISGFVSSGQYYESLGRSFAPLRFTYSLTAADPVVGNVASGVKFSEYRIGGGAFAVYSSTFGLTEGIRSVEYRSHDNVTNTEPLKSATVYVDNTVPKTALRIAGGAQYVGPEPGSFYASFASRFTLEAADPVTNSVASGVRQTFWSDNGGAISYAIEGLAFAEGRHVLSYGSIDNVDNLEVTRSTTILVDNTAPVTTYNIGSPYYAAGGVNYITPATPLTFTAADPVSGEVTSGVSRIEVSLYGSLFGAYSSALKLDEGRHTIKYRAIDNVGNVETERIIEVQSDNTAPISKWTASSGDRIERGNKFYLNALGRIAFESVDSVINEVASGVEGIYYGIDAVPADKYAAPIGLAEGIRTIKFSAKDNVGNTEVVKSTAIYVDGTKPVTELSISGDQHKSDRQYISRRTDIVIAATDPVISDVSVGVKETKYAVDGGSYNDYSLFKLSVEGKRLVSFYSADHVNNVEVAKTAELWVDGTAPLSVLDVLGGKQYPGADPGSFYASLATKFGFVSVDPVVSDEAAGVKAIEYADNNGISAIYSQPISLGEGKHSITYRATDQVENTEVFRSTQIYIDNTAPVTSFNIAGPLYFKEGVRHITPGSELTFTSADPLVSEVSAGVERIETAVDGGQWLKYTQVLKFAEGRHTIKYRAIDNVGNTETERVFEVRSDATPPVTAQHIGAPYYVSGAGVNYITPDTPLTFNANDPVTSDVASGVERIETSIDGGAYASYTIALKFPEGKHTIKYRAYDNVGNLEAAHMLEVQSDSTPPESRWLPANGPWIEKDNKFYLNAIGSIALESADPVRNNVAAGLENIYYGTDAVPAVKYLAAFNLTEGVRFINYSAKDNLGNTELVKSTVVYVDGTKPVTQLSLSGDQYKSDRQYISRRTDIVIAAADPVVSDVSVGVKETKYAVDGGVFSDYSQFKLGAEGRRLVSFYSADHVNNVEAQKTAELWVDGTAPLSVLDVLGGKQYPGLEPGSFYASQATRFDFVSVDPLVSGGAAGVKVTEYADGSGATIAYAQPISPGEGKHSITYRATDQVENIEVFRSTHIYIDNTAPVTSFNIAGPLYLKEGVRHTTPGSELTFTSADPLVSEVSAGVERIETAVDGGQWLKYTQALKFTEGRHTIKYRAIDNVGNTEAERVLEVRSDATPPVTAQHIGAPYYVSGAEVNYITPETPLTFSANDPITSDEASGVERVETAVDGAAYALYSVALKFPEGRHTIKYRTYDNVGNLEAAQTLEVQSDASAPESRWLPASGPWIEKDNKFYLNALGSIAFESADPVRNNVAAGLENIYYGIDAAPSVKYLAAFSLAEGARAINYSAKDNVANTEVVKSTVIYVDGTKPVTGLSLSGDQYNGDKQHISQRTDIIITAEDPVVNIVAVGVKETKYSVDGSAFANYSLFKLSAEGKRLVSYYSTDFVSNIETIKMTALWVDNTPPSTELSIAGARYTAPGDEKLYITRDSGIVLTSSDSIRNDTASGVMLTKYRIDNGNWLVYSGSFTIAAEGLHTLEYYALDSVQNAEALRSAKIAVDNTPPVTGISLGEPKSEVFGLPVLMQTTPITLTAADPVVNSVVAGLNSIFYELENAQTGVRSLVTAYTSPFTITEQGTFIIRYWSKDNTGNTETPKEKMAAVTTWRADGLIAASGLDMSGTADISGSVKSNAVVSLGGNARILGDVTAGTITLSGQGQITGLQINGATPVNPAPVYLAGIVQNAAAVNNNALVAAYLTDGRLVLGSHAGITLSTGTYYFKGMDLSGGSSITIAGKVDILVVGSVTINGGSSMNASGEASRLSIIVSTTSELKFNGGGSLAACVYAPYSDLKLSGNALLGGHYFVKTAAVSGTGNLLQSGEALPQSAPAEGGGGGKKKASAMASRSRAGVLAGPDPEFRLGEVYVFPNPAKGAEVPVFHIETGIADSVKITIYTISGRAAHEHMLTGLPVELDDGNGLSYAYEYTWRGHIPSGVYLYSIEAQKAGQKLKKTGKFGVVR